MLDVLFEYHEQYYEDVVMKLFVLAIICIIIYCLSSGMYHMISKKRNPEKTAKALAWRIGLSLGLFCLLIVGFLMGWIVPHGL